MLVLKICILCFSVLELFSWLIEMTEDAAEIYDGSRIVWGTRFEPHAPEPLRTDSHRNHHNPENRKPTTRLEVQKDDIQAVVPISKVSIFLCFVVAAVGISLTQYCQIASLNGLH